MEENRNLNNITWSQTGRETFDLVKCSEIERGMETEMQKTEPGADGRYHVVQVVPPPDQRPFRLPSSTVAPPPVVPTHDSMRVSCSRFKNIDFPPDRFKTSLEM